MRRTFYVFLAALLAVSPPFFATASEDAPARLAPPEAKALADSTRVIESVYQQDLAKATTPAARLAIATDLLRVAAGSHDKPVDQYALYLKARELAERAGNAGAACTAIDRLAERFDVDPLSLTSDSLTKIAAVVGTREDFTSFSDLCDSAVNSAVARERFDVALRLCDSQALAARRANDAERLKRALSRREEIQTAKAAFDDQKLAQAALRQNPADPKANLIVGKYLCFAKGDWQGGIAYLSRGTDPALRSVAAQEAAAAETPAAKVALGDAWLDLARKTSGPTRIYMQRRALKWFDDAEPALTGLSKARVAKLQASLAESASGIHLFTPEEITARFTLPNKSFRLEGDTIIGKAGNCEDDKTFVWLKEPKRMQSFEFGFKIKSRWYQIAAVEFDGRRCSYSRGHWANQSTQVYVPGKGERRLAGSVASGDDWASIKVVFDGNQLSYYYNGELAATSDPPTGISRPPAIRVGFASHETEIQVKEIYLTVK